VAGEADEAASAQQLRACGRRFPGSVSAVSAGSRSPGAVSAGSATGAPPDASTIEAAKSSSTTSSTKYGETVHHPATTIGTPTTATRAKGGNCHRSIAT
jgi:hypothetical protein